MLPWAPFVTGVTYGAIRTRHIPVRGHEWRRVKLPLKTGIKMLMRSIAALGLILAACQGAAAADQPSHNVSCSQVRFYVALYSLPVAENYARSHGATDAEIEKARHCLSSNPQRQV